MSTESDLMERLALKDQIALEEIYGRYSHRLLSLAIRITGDSGSAEEVLQDTFFQLWLKASQFDATRGSLIGWLLTMVRYRALSRIRERFDLLCDPLSADGAFLASSGRMTALDEQISRELVTAALDSLSEAQREVICLAYFDGLTSKEISIRVGTTISAAKSRQRSAFQKMKKSVSSDLRIPRRDARSSTTLEAVLITAQLLSRPHRQRSAEGEKKSLNILTRAGTSSDRLVETFLQLAIDLCQAGTAGLSLLEKNATGDQVFRWTHMAGALKQYVGGTTPRNFSPCGVTLDHNCPQLFERPGRYFRYFNDLETPIVEGLVIPFRSGKNTKGTVWIVSHQEEITFDSEDARSMTTLAEFAGCALHVAKSVS